MLFLWIAVLVLAIVIEATTSDMVAVWFMPAAIVSLVLSLIPGVPWWVQVLVFVAVGLILVVATRPLCRRLLRGKRTRTNADALIGQICIVTEEIRNIDGLGEVKIGGLCWSARAKEAERIIPVGERVEIVAIEGVKLIVK
ncbi:MAG: NfeD family protein [Ruminococcaceae bacterium]|nr:NfeD family protein [Oscillospiraceae bacterium]